MAEQPSALQPSASRATPGRASLHRSLYVFPRTTKSWRETRTFLKARKPCASKNCKISHEFCFKKKSEMGRSFLYKSTAISSKSKPLKTPDTVFFSPTSLSSRSQIEEGT